MLPSTLESKQRIISEELQDITQGVGDIAFSRDGAGHVFPFHLAAGQELDVREHQFLAATDNVDYNFVQVRGISNLLFGGTGFFIDRFTCISGEGVVWIHGYGNVFEITVSPGEGIDVEPGGWVYKDATVRMETMSQPLAAGLFASAASFAFNRFTGPGRVGSVSSRWPCTLRQAVGFGGTWR